MAVMQKLLAEGTTICATIHSPTATTFARFDALIMLVQGRVVFAGGREDDIFRFGVEHWPFALGGDAAASERTARANVSEWLVEVVTMADRDGQADALADAYAATPLAARNAAHLDACMAAMAASPVPAHLAEQLAVQHGTVTPAWFAIKTIISFRTPRNYSDPEFVAPRVADKVMLTILIFTLFLRAGRDTATDNVNNIASVLFMWVVLPGACRRLAAATERSRARSLRRGDIRAIHRARARAVRARAC
jgi:ATP-binding cassette subfamily G (WHITE) protein 2